MSFAERRIIKMIHEIDDIMQYYYMNFISVYCLYIIIILSSIFSLKRKRNARKYLLYSTVAEIGICSNLFFTGVLQDNQAPGISFWNHQLWVLFVTSAIGWLISFIQMIRKHKERPESKI